MGAAIDGECSVPNTLPVEPTPRISGTTTDSMTESSVTSTELTEGGAQTLATLDSFSNQPVVQQAQHDWRFYAAFGTLCILNLIIALDSTILSVALPTIAEDLSATSVQAFWCGTSFLLASAVIQPPMTSLSHVFGRKSALLWGLTSFTVGSIIGGLAHSIAVLYVGRILQGLGSGSILSLTYVITTDLVSLRERGKWFGLISLSSAVGTLLGPLIGGAFVSVSWRWIFWINLPLCGLAYIFVFFLLRLRGRGGSIKEKLKRVDWAGAFIFMSSLTSILIPITWGGVMYTWTSYHTLVPLLVGTFGLLALGCYLGMASRYLSVDPLVRLSLFTSLTTVGALFATILHGIITWCLLYYVPLYHEVRGSSALNAAVSMTPFTATVAPAAVVIGLVITKTGRYRLLMWMGWVVNAVGLGLLMLLDENTETFKWVLIYLTTGLALGILFSSQAFAAQAGASNVDLPFAASFYAFCRSIGQCLGVAIGSVVFQNQFQKSLVEKVGSNPEVEMWAKDASALVEILRHMSNDSMQTKTNIVKAYMDALRTVWMAMMIIACAALAISIIAVKEKGLDRDYETEHGISPTVHASDVKVEAA